MVGIYRIINIITNESYVGQSKDICNRIEEHFYHRTATNRSMIDDAINYYGIENFMFQILELCKVEDLDWKEDFYISLYNSNKYGYNIVRGGQHNIGESNSNVKLSEQDVYNIREAYNNHLDCNEIYKIYSSKISPASFFNIWEGKSWTYIHMDVYNDENMNYYKSNIRDKSYSDKRFTKEEVLYYRNRYMNETVSDIFKTINFDCKYNTFKSMVTGSTYKQYPIYNKKRNEWTN